MWPAVRLATDGADRHRAPPVSGGPLSFTLPARPQRHDSFRRVCEFCTSLFYTQTPLARMRMPLSAPRSSPKTTNHTGGHEKRRPGATGRRGPALVVAPRFARAGAPRLPALPTQNVSK